jgi:putative transposase
MILTKKIKLNIKKESLDKLWLVSNLCTELWNVALEQRRYRSSFGKVNIYSQKKELPLIKKEFNEFKIPSSQVLQNVLFSLDRGYKMFFTKLKKGDRDVNPPKFKSRNFFFTQEYSQPKSSFVIENNQLKLAFGKNKKEWITIDLKGEVLPESAKTINLSYDNVSKIFYASVTYKIKDVVIKKKGSEIYFDSGCKTSLVGLKNNGKFFEYDMNPLRKINFDTYKLIDKLCSKRDKKVKNSNAWRRLSKRIKKLWRKINTRTKTYLHTLANKILRDHKDVKSFKIGDWTSQKTVSKEENKFLNKRINRAVQNNNPLEILIGYLSYKAKMKGQVVERFNERGTTRTCSKCDKKHEDGLNPSIRVFKCIDDKCGFKYSRDHQSCLNFYKKFNSAKWLRLLGNLPKSSIKVSLKALSFKPQVEEIQLSS